MSQFEIPVLGRKRQNIRYYGADATRKLARNYGAVFTLGVTFFVCTIAPVHVDVVKA